jgi:hypothetical protein
MLILSLLPLLTVVLVFFLPIIKRGELQAPAPEPEPVGTVEQTG